MVSWRFALAVGLVACSTVPPAPDAALDAPADTTDASSGSPQCAVPAGADPRVGVATARPGLTCVRYPFPIGAPRDVIETRAGNILVTDQRDGTVVQLTSGGFAPLVTGLSQPIGMREATDGSLFITEETPQVVSQWIPGMGSTAMPIVANLGNVTYLAWGPDGALYVSTYGQFIDPAQIVRLAPDGMGSFMLGATFATNVYVPEQFFFDASGRMVVADWSSQGGGAAGPAQVLRLPSGGGSGATADVVVQGFDHVYGVAAGAGGTVFVGEIHSGSSGQDAVVQIAADGSATPVVTGLTVPTGMAVASNGDLLVLEGVSTAHDADGYLLRISGF